MTRILQCCWNPDLILTTTATNSTTTATTRSISIISSPSRASSTSSLKYCGRNPDLILTTSTATRSTQKQYQQSQQSQQHFHTEVLRPESGPPTSAVATPPSSRLSFAFENQTSFLTHKIHNITFNDFKENTWLIFESIKTLFNVHSIP